MMTFDEVLSCFDVKSRSNGTVNARCPAHKDKNPSLSISRANHGGSIFHCHAGCTPEAVLEAAGLTWADVTPDREAPGPLTRRTASRRSPRRPEPEPVAFWTAERRNALQAAQKRLRAAPNHPLLGPIQERDIINRETLMRYGCGFHAEHAADWLILPYETGTQLYRREDGGKRLLSLKGSKPSASFFGITKTQGAPDLIIAKSPRECMLLAQELEGVDVIGLAGGESPKLSDEQAAILQGLEGVETIRVAMDCDTDKAKAVAESFTKAIAEAVPATVGLIDVTKATGGQHKDLTDVMRSDGRKALPAILAGAAVVEPRPSLQTAPALPRTLFAALHPELQAACNALSAGHERDVFTVGLLPCLSAGMPHVLTRYARRWKALALSAAVVAPAGSGKGALMLAGDTVRRIDERLREESLYRLEEWQALPDKERKGKPRPPFRRLHLGADTSLRGITDGLVDNDGRGLIFESEIKVLDSSLGQDWGDFKGLLLKAAEQEPYERTRKDEPPVHIARPEIAAALSGTPRSFTDWLEDAEDGLFSRFLFYTFEAPPVWQNQFADDSDEVLEAALGQIAERLNGIYNALQNRPQNENGRPEPLYLKIEPADQTLINAAFAELLTHVDESERPELYASVKRGAFQAVRIAGVMAAYRLAASGGDLSKAKTYSPTTDEVQGAVSLVRCLLSHAARLAERFARDPSAKLESEERRRFYDALPEGFATAEAQEIGATLSMNPRKVERALAAMVRADLLTRESRGIYRKPAADTFPTPLAEVSEAVEASEASEDSRKDEDAM